MPKTQYYTATTIDGYIADRDNSLDWLFEVDEGGENPYDAFYAGVGALAMGATTYRWILDHAQPSDWPYGDTPTWVFTHGEPPPIPGAALSFVQGDVRPVHEVMTRAAGGKNIWLVGGGELVGAFADAGLLNEIILGVAPVTLGGGAPVLPRHLRSSRLSLSDVRQVGQFAYLTYQVA